MHGPLPFTSLKKLLGVTDGALGVHLSKLEEIGYIGGNTILVGRHPKTTYRLTAAGRGALLAYLESMRKLLDALERNRRERH